ncbi:hypothetical protein [Haladaptatus sp. DJG-WS-42]|uniref:hypothetical protein n=1 Tax=Haladaptatus sp. DJG-WS-42 TaxID=3120516 RepID=UPI0030CB29AE
MRRVVATLAVSLLLVAAGCNGFTGQGEQTADFSATPVNVPDDSTPGPSLDYPPGVTHERLQNGVELREAHTEWVSEKGYVLEYGVIKRPIGADGFEEFDTTLTIESNRSNFHQRTVHRTASRDSPAVTELWGTEANVYEMEVKAGEPKFEIALEIEDDIPHQDGKHTIDGLGRRDLTLLLNNDENVSIEPRMVNGGQAFFLRGEEIPPGTFFTGPQQHFTETPGFEVHNVSFRLLVTSEGHIREYHYTLVGEKDGTPYVESVSGVYERVGDVTVSPPRWVDEANRTLDSGSTTEATSA